VPIVNQAALHGPRDSLAVAAAWVVAAVTHRLGHGGTSLPGLVAERLAPGIRGRAASDLGPIVLVSGTNGKTTTTRLLTHILDHTGRATVTNPSGANLGQAITSTLLSRKGLGGRRGKVGATAVLEVDEANLNRITASMPVTLLLTTNLFRDQLDRFGETDEIVHRWRQVLDTLPPGALVVYCADDPRLTQLVASHQVPSRGFGLSEAPAAGVEVSLTEDVGSCPRCEASLTYAWRGSGLLGSFECGACGFCNTPPWLRVRVVASRGLSGQTLAFRGPDSAVEHTVDIQLPGISNAYNAAAAVTAATYLGVELTTAVAALGDASSPWGRYEEVSVDGRRVILALGKNPASLAELVQIGTDPTISAVLVAVNDAFADGLDVSWYWDIDPLAVLADKPVAISGSRARDFQLRLKYQLADDQTLSTVGLFDDPADGLQALVDATQPGEVIYVIATYTALLQLRAGLVSRHLAASAPR
jgi:UDP-N-acetylmuramyl tripeptide synthase